MAFWVHPFLVQYGFNVEVNLGSRKSILDVTSTPSPSSSSSDDDHDPSRRPTSTCCFHLPPCPPSLAVIILIS